MLWLKLLFRFLALTPATAAYVSGVWCVWV